MSPHATDSTPPIAAIFETPVGRPIEPVVQVAALDDATEIAAQIDATVITPLLEQHLVRFAEAYAGSAPTLARGTGVWIDGVYGSGKSHLAKLLALFADNRSLDSVSAGRRIAARLPKRSRARSELEQAQAKLEAIDTHLLPLNLASLGGSSQASLAAELLGRHYRAVGYCGNLLYARVIEAELDRLGRLDALRAEAERRSGVDWSELGTNPTFHAKALAEAAVAVAPEQFASVQEVARALDHAARGTAVDLGLAVDEMLDSLARLERHRQRPQRMLCVLDEAGAWIGRDAGRLAELGHLLELAQRQPARPLWVVVVTHADLEAVSARVGAPEADRRTIESRFAMRLSLDDENLARVLEQRVLAKTAAGGGLLRRLYAQRGGAIRDLCELGGCGRPHAVCDERGFVTSYPFAPYWSELVPELVRALRARGGHDPELGGSTRTLLALAQDVLRSGSSSPAELQRGAAAVGSNEPLVRQPVGAMASFDALYPAFVASADLSPALVREVTHAVDRIRDQFSEAGGGGAASRSASFDELQALALRLPPLLALLEPLSDVPRTVPNLARLLACHVRDDLTALTDAVRSVVQRLEQLGVVSCVHGQVELLVGARRLLEEQVAQLRGSLDHQAISSEFADLFVRAKSAVRWERWLGLRAARVGKTSFGLRLSVDGKLLAPRGELAVHVLTPLETGTSAGGPAATLEALEQRSARAEEQLTAFVWCAPSVELEGDLRELLARREVLERWTAGSAAAQEAIVASERLVREQTTEQATRALEASLLQGCVVFRGSRWNLAGRGATVGSALGSVLSEIGAAIYPKLRQVPERIDDAAEPIVALLEGRRPPPEQVGGIELWGPDGAVVSAHPLFDGIRIALASCAAGGAERPASRGAGRQRRGRSLANGPPAVDAGAEVGVLGADLVGRLRAAPYGWDRAVVQLGVAAMVREGTVTLAQPRHRAGGSSSFALGEQLAERAAFERVRLELVRSDADRLDLGAVRELVVALLGTRQVAETEGELDAAVGRLAERAQQRIAVAQAWHRGAALTAPAELGRAASQWRASCQADQPLERLGFVVRHREALREGFALAERYDRWLGRWGDAVGGLRRLAHAVDAYLDELPVSSAARQLQQAVRGWEREPGTLLNEALSPVLELQDVASAELAHLVDERRRRVLGRIDAAMARVDMPVDPAAGALGPSLQRLRDIVATEADPCAVASAAGRLDALLLSGSGRGDAPALASSPPALPSSPDGR